MSHLKRAKMPKNWPVPRKGTTFVIKPVSKKGIPCLMVLRDMLKAVQNRKEMKKIIHKKQILVNNKPLRDEKIALSLFDTLSLIPSKTYYKLVLSDNGKFDLEKITEKEINEKIVKIISKKIIKNKKIQLNLSDGRNILSDIKCNINDSLVLNFKDKKIEKCLPLVEKAEVIVFAGKHAGEKGKIEKIIPERKMAIINEGKNRVNILIKQLMVVK